MSAVYVTDPQRIASIVGAGVTCAALLVMWIGLMELTEWMKRARAYWTLPGCGGFGVHRRLNGHVEVVIGRLVFTTEPR